MTRYSAFSLMREGLRGHRGWRPAWAKAKPKRAYDAVIVGGGGHGLATAYYLARNHGLTRVSVLEKGWIGGGNTGRNTTAVRSNYFYPESVALYDLSLRLYEGPSRLVETKRFLFAYCVRVTTFARDAAELTGLCSSFGKRNKTS